jgi:hypothetical protein
MIIATINDSHIEYQLTSAIIYQRLENLVRFAQRASADRERAQSPLNIFWEGQNPELRSAEH